ncbi:MFS transporter [Natronorubrum sp. DTA7]|uniref:MFS transporter n=1 Tax=Natronorubrum sp. DTA7 TaxID=3447016 RepID=UPI003F826280
MERRTRVLALASLVIGLATFVWSNYAAVLPAVAADWRLTGTESGLIHAAFFAGYLVAILPAGFVADRTSARWLVGLSATATGLSSLAFGLVAGGLGSGLLFRFLTGLCFAGVYVPGMRLVSDWYPPSIRGRAIGIYVGVFSVGSGVVFPIAGGLAARSDWRVAIAATSAGVVLAGPLLIGLAADHPNRTTAGFDLDLSVFSNRAYLYAVGGYVGHNWELFAVQNWILAYLVVTPAVVATGSASAVGGLLAGLVVAIGAVGNVVAGWASDEIGRIPLSAFAMTVGGILTLALGWFSFSSVVMLVAVLGVYGVLLAADSTPLSTAITELVDDEHTGAALAGQSLLGFVPGLLSPLAFGVALDTDGFGLAFATAAIGALVGVYSLWLLRRHLCATGSVTESTLKFTN